MRGLREQKSRGGVRLATVLRIYKDDGHRVADVVDIDGSVWLRCRYTAAGAGGARSFHRQGTPDPGDDATVILSFLDGSAPSPLIVGALDADGSEERFTTIADPDDGDDYPAENGDTAEVIEHRGTRILIGDKGELVLDTTRSGRPIRAQLPTGGVFRISRDGEADGQLLLASPTRDYIDALTAKVNELGAQVAALTATIVATQVAASVPAAPATLPVWAESVALALSTAPYAYTPAANTSDDLVASALAIPAQSIAED